MQYGVKRLTLFGSALTDSFHEQSDIDFLVELDDSPQPLFRFIGLKDMLEEILDRQVDVVMPKAIENPLLKEYIFEKTEDVCAA